MEKKFITNKFGIQIVQCCASCVNNIGASGSEYTRICNAGEGIVKPSSWCGQWKMRQELDNAGLGGGEIKKRQYLEFFKNYEQPEDIDKKKTRAEIRKEYEDKYGSIYI